MKKKLAIYNSYAGQHGPDGCGIACLTLLLNYYGSYDESERLICFAQIPPGGFSLLALRDMASDFQFKSSCVKTDSEILWEFGSPGILHTVTMSPHFECIATVRIILVLLYGIYCVSQRRISYNILMTEDVVCYYITMLTTKISQTFPDLTDGARTIKKYQF